jgi:hypothetical protein
VKRVLIGVITVAVLVGIGTAEAKKPPKAPKASKTAICHRTMSTAKPYVRISVGGKAALKGHARHAGDIIPAPTGGCPTTALSPTAGGVVLTAAMNGANEVPTAGDPDGTGTATFRMVRGGAQICYQLNVSNITLPATAAHIHLGATGVKGNVVVPLNAPDASGQAMGCATTTRALVAAILDNPAGYYANVHTSDFPDGAIRGQLSA